MGVTPWAVFCLADSAQQDARLFCDLGRPSQPGGGRLSLQFHQCLHALAQILTGTRFVGTIGPGRVERVHHKLVPPVHLAVRDDPLKIPCRTTRPAARRRLRQANPVPRAKHLDKRQVATRAEIPRLGVAMPRKGERQFQRKRLDVSEFAVVTQWPVRCVQAVLRRDPANPVRRTRLAFGPAHEMDVERFGPVNVAGPEQQQVAVPPCGPSGNALEGQLQHALRAQHEAVAALEAVIRRGRLVEFDGVAVNDAQFHRGVARFEQNSPRLGRAVQDVLEVQTRIGGHEQISRLPRVLERSQAAVAGAVSGQHGIIHRVVVHDHHFEVAAAEHHVRLVRHGEIHLPVRQRRARRRFGGGEQA